MKKIMLFFVLIFLLLPISSALIISPSELDISEVDFEKTYQFVITVVNDINETVNISFSPDDDFVYLQPSRFVIEGEDKSNTKLVIDFPADMEPGNGTILIYPEGFPYASLTVYYSVPRSDTFAGEMVEEESEESSFYEEILLVVSIIILLLVFVVIFFRSYLQTLRLKKRSNRLHKDVDNLTKEVSVFFEESNKWLEEKGKMQFK